MLGRFKRLLRLLTRLRKDELADHLDRFLLCGDWGHLDQLTLLEWSESSDTLAKVLEWQLIKLILGVSYLVRIWFIVSIRIHVTVLNIFLIAFLFMISISILVYNITTVIFLLRKVEADRTKSNQNKI